MTNDAPKLTLLAAIAVVAHMVPTHAEAQDGRPVELSLKAKTLDEALKEVSRQTGREIMYLPEVVAGRTTVRLEGRMTAEDAIRALLRGTGLAAEFQRDAVIIRTAQTAEVETPSDVTVTGSRIRGGRSVSPVLVRTRETLRDEGIESTAEAVARIPQNFGGGQNPGVGLGTPGSANINGGTTLNLRGLGPDATLTLLNGHRLAYGAQRQSVDVSQIPFVAIERIEIVPDGSSALYGSDAVGGVANIITRSSFEGLLTSARAGWSTGGGNAQQQYDVLAGTRWSSGGVIAAGEFARNTPIEASQRDYAKDRAPGLTLQPRMRHASGLVRAEHGSGDLRFSVEGLYNRRRSDLFYALDQRGDPLASGGRVLSNSESWSMAPAARLAIGPTWTVAGILTYSEDQTRYAAIGYSAGAALAGSTYICYCNSAATAEISADGNVLDLPAGPVRLAIGTGWRRNDLKETNLRLDKRQSALFAYGELQAPILGAAESVAPLGSLTATAAVRYERIAEVAEIVTPKLGAVWAMPSGVEVRGSWGRSFRAPTLFQQYSVLNVTVQRASARGGTGYPATATVLQLTGGNPDLKPERAVTWTATVAVRPRAVKGLELEASYFSIDYRDRIVAPITFINTALSNPVYQDLVTRAPSAAEKAAAVASGNFLNNSGRPYDPGDVVAIVNNRNTNAALQTARGVDGSVSLARSIGERARLSIRAQASYLESTQRLSALQPVVPLSGRIFNPARFRARGGAVLAVGGLTLSGFVDRVSGLEDSRTAALGRIPALTTLDLAARVRLDRAEGPLRGLELGLAVQNAFDADPPIVSGRAVYEQPYDPTNFGATGRLISLTASKTW